MSLGVVPVKSGLYLYEEVMIVRKAVAGRLGVLRFADAVCHRPWRMRHELPRVRGMRYLLAMTETVEPVLPVVLDGQDVWCWRLCGLQGGSL